MFSLSSNTGLLLSRAHLSTYLGNRPNPLTYCTARHIPFVSVSTLMFLFGLDKMDLCKKNMHFFKRAHPNNTLGELLNTARSTVFKK